jgi:hypothetical protein
LSERKKVLPPASGWWKERPPLADISFEMPFLAPKASNYSVPEAQSSHHQQDAGDRVLIELICFVRKKKSASACLWLVEIA